jgi:hypothetical protein
MNERAASAWDGRRLALAVGLLLLASACHRKAPGPDECRDFAYRVVGIRTEIDAQVPGAIERADELTTECLLTPFDRELLACVEQGAGVRLCMHQFAARHTGLTNAVPPHERQRRRELPPL